MQATIDYLRSMEKIPSKTAFYRIKGGDYFSSTKRGLLSAILNHFRKKSFHNITTRPTSKLPQPSSCISQSGIPTTARKSLTASPCSSRSNPPATLYISTSPHHSKQNNRTISVARNQELLLSMGRALGHILKFQPYRSGHVISIQHRLTHAMDCYVS